MDIPLEIVFHNIKPSDEIDGLIREHVARLEKLYPHLIGCRVSVEMLHKQHRTGNVPEVHVAIRVPGKEIAISREPQKAKQRHASPNVHTSIKDAFRAAEKRLKDFKRVQRGDVKMKEAPLQAHIAALEAEKNFGFIATGNGGDLYFHRNSVADDGFDSLRVGDAVQYTVVQGDKGPSAGRVWRTAEANVTQRARQLNGVEAGKS
ncbi:MAG TPA: HPF/RaiA family ribosome-associated protein [Rhizomicrobium sp.]|jgi:cold shock CspA family protein